MTDEHLNFYGNLYQSFSSHIKSWLTFDRYIKEVKANHEAAREVFFRECRAERGDGPSVIYLSAWLERQTQRLKQHD